MQGNFLNYDGENLREIRVRRKKTQTDIAEILGVARQMVWQYEHNERIPDVKAQVIMAEFLDAQVKMFSRTINRAFSFNSQIFFRRLLKANLRQRASAEVLARWALDLVDILSAYYKFPKYEHLNLRQSRPVLNSNRMEKQAQAVREAWGMGDGSIRNLAYLIEGKGIFIFDVTVENSIDAFSARINQGTNEAAIILRNKADHEIHKRFAAAHELYHIIFHHGLTDAQFGNSAHHKIFEDQADYFAGAFLIPRSSFIKTVTDFSVTALKVNAERWGVPIHSLVKRAQGLNIITANKARYLYRRINEKGVKEPQIEPECPVLIPDAVRRLNKKGKLAEQNLQNLFPIEDLIELTGNRDIIAEIASRTRSESNVSNFQRNM